MKYSLDLGFKICQLDIFSPILMLGMQLHVEYKFKHKTEPYLLIII